MHNNVKNHSISTMVRFHDIPQVAAAVAVVVARPIMILKVAMTCMSTYKVEKKLVNLQVLSLAS